MRIGFLLDSATRTSGGLFESVRRLAQSIRRTHDRTTIFSIRNEFSDDDEPSWLPIRVRSFEPALMENWGFAPSLMKAIIDSDLKILHAHGLWKYSSVASLRWHRRTQRPYVVHSHGMLDSWALRNSGWKKRVASLLYEQAHLRNAACLRALCRSEADSIRSLGLRNPICLLPNGIDIPEAAPTMAFPLPEHAHGKRVLLYLGRLHPKKNLAPLIHAWARQRRENPEADDWILSVVGWDQGGYEEKLKVLSKELQVDDSVHFAGPLFGEAKAAAYHHSSAFILPSLSEGLPMVVLEAWAHAKPVLMTAECNLPEGFETEAAIEIGSTAEAISAGLKKLINLSEDQRDQIGQSGLSLVADRFSWKKIGSDLMQVNEWLVNGADKPQCIID